MTARRRCPDCNALVDEDNGLCPFCADDEAFLGPLLPTRTARDRFGNRVRP